MSAEQFERNLNRYAKAFSQAVQREDPLTTKSRNDLKRLQNELNLREDNIAPVEKSILRDWIDIKKYESFVSKIGFILFVLFFVALLCVNFVPVVGSFLWFVWVILFFVGYLSSLKRDSKKRKFNS